MNVELCNQTKIFQMEGCGNQWSIYGTLFRIYFIDFHSLPSDPIQVIWHSQSHTLKCQSHHYWQLLVNYLPKEITRHRSLGLDLGFFVYAQDWSKTKSSMLFLLTNGSYYTFAPRTCKIKILNFFLLTSLHEHIFGISCTKHSLNMAVVVKYW